MSQSTTLHVHRNFRECFADVHGNFLLKAMFFKDAEKKTFSVWSLRALAENANPWKIGYYVNEPTGI